MRVVKGFAFFFANIFILPEEDLVTVNKWPASEVDPESHHSKIEQKNEVLFIGNIRHLFSHHCLCTFKQWKFNLGGLLMPVYAQIDGKWPVFV